MRITIFLLGLTLMLASGCSVVSQNRVFPKLTWHWSADAKQERAYKEIGRQQAEELEKQKKLEKKQ